MRMRIGVVVLAAAGLAACDLDLTNPNAPTELDVLTSTEGVITLAVAMQGQMGHNLHHYIRGPALVTDEWGVTTFSLAGDRSLVTGDPDRTFLSVADPFNRTYLVMRSATNLIENADVVPGIGLQTGITALAELYKAMALGWNLQHFEEMPIQLSTEGAPFASRGEVLDTILAVLESARARVTEPGIDLAGFRQRVLPAAFNLENTINAMLARYHLIAGNYQAAIDAAARVPLDQLSVWVYPDPQRNPIYNYNFELNYTGARLSFVEEAEAGDQRPDFWVQTDFVDPPAPGIEGLPILPIRQYSDRNDPFPVYLPGEMLLIQAEAHARLGNLVNAVDFINQVRTQCVSPVNEPTACLDPWVPVPPTQNAILAQIAYERRYELYMQGLRWEDLRRFATSDGVVEDRQSISWLPVPNRECETNPFAPC